MQAQPIISSVLPVLALLVLEFWLSGIWILSLIFTAQDIDHLQHTNFFMFITLGIGSLVGGYASDIVGRVNVFRIGALVWLAGAVLVLVQDQVGYVVAAGSIGLLNNITFVLLMEFYPENKDQYTIYVLIGWAASQISLGIIFYLISNKEYFYIILFILTLLFTISCFLFLQSPVNEQNPQNQSLIECDEQQIQNEENAEEGSWWKKAIPHSWKPLIGGCILMFVMQMFYYRTQFTLDRFGVSIQLNTIVVGCTQLLANVIFTKVINMYPRKFFLRLFLIVLTALFLILMVTDNKAAQTVVQGVMRLFDTFIMIVLGVYLPELFDIDERGKGTNYVMSFGVLGSALNSIILNSFKFWQLIFFLIIGFISTFLFKQTLPPQHKQELPNSQQT